MSIARLVLLVALVAVPTAGAASPPQIWSPDGSRVVRVNEAGDVYTLDPDTSSTTQLTTGGDNRDAAWSPDGSRIAYVHERYVRDQYGLPQRDDQVWLVAPDGTGARQLTHDRSSKSGPEWSHDGSRLLYWGGGLVVVDAGTGRVRPRTGDSDGSWSPDDSRIAAGNTDGIDVLNADGSGRRTVARTGPGGWRTFIGEPVWSPDGMRLAFTRSHCSVGIKGMCGYNLDSVYVVGADGTGERRLTGPISGGPGAGIEGFPFDDSAFPVWWPDGSQLFFGRQTLYAMNADGTCEHSFGPDPQVVGAAWQPGATLPPTLRCVDLRVRVVPHHDPVGLRGDARVYVVVENDGTDTATGMKLTVQPAYGHSQIRPPLPSCRGAPVVECDLAPLAAGGTVRLVVEVGNLEDGLGLRAKVTANETDSDPVTNDALRNVGVLDCDVVGTSGADRLHGTPGRDTICGRAGPDIIRAGAGNDTIKGNRGNDVIRAGPGHDVVSGGDGTDRIYARDGERDLITCGPGRDTVHADRIDEVARGCERVGP